MPSGHRARKLLPRRWSMLTQSGVVGDSPRSVERGVGAGDRPTMCARRRRLRRRGSGHRVPRWRRRSRRGRTRRRATTVSSASISTMLSASVLNRRRAVARGPRREHVRERDALHGSLWLPNIDHRRSRCRRPPARRRSRHLDRVGFSAFTTRRRSIDAEITVGHELSHQRPSRGPRSTTTKRSSRPGSPRSPTALRRPAELVEPRDRGVQVRLVEDFAAVDHVARRPSRGAIPRHSASKPSLRSLHVPHG